MANAGRNLENVIHGLMDIKDKSKQTLIKSKSIKTKSHSPLEIWSTVRTNTGIKIVQNQPLHQHVNLISPPKSHIFEQSAFGNQQQRVNETPSNFLDYLKHSKETINWKARNSIQ
jgi:hypothetical protein